MKRVACLMFLAVLAGCGGKDSNSSSTPVAPSGPSAPSAPAIAQVGGVWTGTVIQTSASGGPECLSLFQSSNGASDRYTVQITQNGSALTATAASQTGVSCNYTGTAGGSTMALTGTGCTSAGYQVTCNGFARDAVRVSYSAFATVNGNSMTGTTGASYNIFPRGSSVNGLGIVVLNNSFTFAR